MSIPKTQLQYQFVRQAQGFSLQLREGAPIRAPAPREVLVRVRATSLNRRDRMIQKGQYPVGDIQSFVPLSDGAGEVVAVGRDVRRFRVGDRVAGNFFQRWIDGRPQPDNSRFALGGGVDGLLAQYVALDEDGWVAMPTNLSFEQAATLPCAAVTAWSGLASRGRMRSGDNVLLLGTGGVSIFGLQFAVAAGARGFITSSSDDKLAQARALGAAGTVNYRAVPDWEKSIVEQSGGVQHVLEVGGAGTLVKSLAALSTLGHIALIGGLSSGFSSDVPAIPLVIKNASVSGITVGSRADFEAMNAFIAKHGITPVIDRSFAFDAAAEALDYLDTGNHFGKVVIVH